MRSNEVFKLVVAAAGLFASSLLFAASPVRAGAVECGKRYLGEDEFAVCRFEHLREMDLELDRLYRRLLRLAPPGSRQERRLVRSQRRFIDRRQECDRRVDCLERRYERRLRRLRYWLANVPGGIAPPRAQEGAVAGLNLGEVELDDSPLKLTLPVGTSRGRFSSLRLRVRRADSIIDHVVVVFANGGRQDFDMGTLIRRGQSSDDLLLRGGRMGRHIARVEVHGRVVERGRNDAEVDIIALPASTDGDRFAYDDRRDEDWPADDFRNDDFRNDELRGDDWRGDDWRARPFDPRAEGPVPLPDDAYRDDRYGEGRGEAGREAFDRYDDDGLSGYDPRTPDDAVPPRYDEPPFDPPQTLGRRAAPVEEAAPQRRDRPRRDETGPAPRRQADLASPRAARGRNLEQRLERFVSDTFHRTTRMSADELRRVYSERVDYYGQESKLVDEIIADKLNYAKRWPERNFEVREGTLKVVKTNRSGEYDVSYDYAFMVRGPGRQSKGVGRSELRVREESDRFVILSEQGRILQRL